MAGTYDVVDNNGSTITTTTYTCEAKSMSYTIISQDIKNDFNFLIKELPEKLDEALNNIKSAANINDAFYIENGAKYNDLMHVYQEIQKDISGIKLAMTTLHGNFMTSIDNVNAELGNNFGYWAFTKPKEAGKKVEKIESKN